MIDEEKYLLPCDVKLEPATVIAKGCKLSTLLVALNERKKRIDKWEADCRQYWGHILTGERRHYCPDWDYLPIDETCREIESCGCRIKCEVTGFNRYRV